MTEASKSATLAVDIGGTKIAMARVEGDRVLDRLQFATPRTGKGGDLVAEIVARVPRLGTAHQMAVATTGIVRSGRLTALNPGTLPIENGFPLVEALERAVSLPVYAANDAQAAAWGEYRYGAGNGCSNFAFVTVSTGIGAGLIIDGRLAVGRQGLAGHLGHASIDPSGPLCGCGRRGCLEAIASGTALAAKGSARFGRVVNAPELFDAAAAGDGDAQALIGEAVEALAVAFGNLAATCDVDRIAIGGGVGLAGGFVEKVNRAVERLPRPFRREVVPAMVGANAGLIGIAGLDVFFRH